MHTELSSMDEMASELHELAVRENTNRKKMKATIALSAKDHESYVESMKARIYNREGVDFQKARNAAASQMLEEYMLENDAVIKAVSDLGITARNRETETIELRRQLKSLWQRYEGQNTEFGTLKQKLYDLEARRRNRDYNIVTDKQRKNIFGAAEDEFDFDKEKQQEEDLYAGMDEDTITMSKIKALTAGMPGLDFLNNMEVEQGVERDFDFMQMEVEQAQINKQQKAIAFGFAPATRVLTDKVELRSEQAAVPYSEDAWAAAAGMVEKQVDVDVSNQGLHGGALQRDGAVRSGVVQAPVPVAVAATSGGDNSLKSALAKAARGTRKVAKVPQLYNGQAVPRQMPNAVTRLGAQPAAQRQRQPNALRQKAGVQQVAQNTTRLNIQDESAQLLGALSQDATLTSMEFIPTRPSSAYVRERDVDMMVEA